MNLQTVTSTDIQRGFAKILNNLTDPVLVMRDSRPAAVLQSVEDYFEVERLKKELLKKEFMGLMKARRKAARFYSDEEIDRDIAEAINAVRRRRRQRPG